MAMTEPSEHVDATLLRRTMAGFATGVAVVTTEDGGELHGMTVNSLTSVSLEPPLVLVCFTDDARTAAAAARRGAFALHLLSRRQQALSDRFAGRGEDHFEGVDVALDEIGLPVLPGGLGRLTCRVETTYQGGDHVIVVGRVVACEPRDGTPLLFYRGRYHDIHLGAGDTPWLW
ncbi:MAG: flavin reductase family protein [Thermoleophilaceae bacterium]